MKVHCFGNEWCDQCLLTMLLLLITVCCMLMQKQQYASAAAVDSEISKGGRSNGAGGIVDIDKHAWPPMKNHDIWSDESTYENNESFSSSDRASEAGEAVFQTIDRDEIEFVANSLDSIVNPFRKEAERNDTLNEIDGGKRRSKVLHIFPVPVDGECLSDDGRRIGTCFNAYECRQKGGTSKGQCAMGFGVCCIFIANCNDTISNNITYLISPQFPSFMPNNFSSCSIKVKPMSDDISQLRIDFQHFSLGQPNRRTGVCDGDVFNISGGPGGIFSLCGQNSGQHLYYDVGGRSLPRQTLYGSLRPPTFAQIYPNFNGSNADRRDIEISMNFAQRFLSTRLWEIRIAQIPFSQRAPAGCLQYHTGIDGIIQTFNFADNGRHLANQHYRVCMRQETAMCSIMYQPCDEQSFRIGPSRPLQSTLQQSQVAGTTAVSGGGGGGVGVMNNIGGTSMPGMMNIASMQTTMGVLPPNVPPVAADDPNDSLATPASTQIASTSPNSVLTSTTMAIIRSSTEPPASSTPSSTGSMSTSTITTTTTTTGTATATTAAMPTSTNAPSTASTSTTPMSTTSTSAAAPERTTTTSTTTAPPTTTTTATTPFSDDVEGSGDDSESVTPGSLNVSRRPRPVSGGFDLLGFLRSAFELGLRRRRSMSLPLKSSEVQSQRQHRQIFSLCSDRITLPCIIEDFIGTGLGPLPSCEPIHCGTQFCASGVWPCRIESTVTPFFINIHFGDGIGKGSAEDNIGACLRYTQMQCL